MTPRQGSILTKPFIEASRAIGLKAPLTLRGMRRTFNRIMKKAEIDDMITRGITGHATAAMQARYSTVLGNGQEQGIYKVIQLITPATRSPAGGKARRSGREGRR